MIQDHGVQTLMDELDLPPDRANLFEVIDADGSGTLHITELVQVDRLNQDAKTMINRTKIVLTRYIACFAGVLMRKPNVFVGIISTNVTNECHSVNPQGLLKIRGDISKSATCTNDVFFGQTFLCAHFSC